MGTGFSAGIGSDLTIYNNVTTVAENGSLTFYQGAAVQIGPIGLSTTRFGQNGHLNTNIELKLRFSGDFGVWGGSGIKVW